MKYTCISIFFFLLTTGLYAQEPYSTEGHLCTMGMMSDREDSTKPYFEFPEDVGFRLRLKEVRDKNRKLQQAIFYRDRAGSKPTDTIEEKQLFKNGKVYDVIVYYNPPSEKERIRKLLQHEKVVDYDGKIHKELKYDDKGRKIADIQYGATGKINYGQIITYGTDGSCKYESYAGGIISYTRIQDAQEREIERINYDSTGNILDKTISQYSDKESQYMEYDGGGLLVKKIIKDNTTDMEETTDYYKSGKIKHVSKDDVDRSPIEEQEYKENGSGSKTIWFPPKLDQIGMKGVEVYRPHIVKNDKYGTDTASFTREASEAIYYDTTGKVTRKYAYKYDDHGNITESDTYDASDKMLDKTTYTNTYGADGNETERITYDSTGTLFRTDDYVYNKQGKMIKDIKNQSGKKKK